MSEKNMIIPKGASAALVLADTKVFFGRGIGHKATSIGEICFNTGLTGYQEVLTDLSYAGQIITFTFPHIGNVGINEEDQESTSIAAKGLIIRDDITNPSNFRSANHLNDWLKKQKVTGICGLDTRAITRYIRNNGAQNAAICFFGDADKFDLEKITAKLKEYPSLKGMELAKTVTSTKQNEWKQNKWKLGASFGEVKNPKYKVVAVDFGAKLNILRCLAELECDVTVVPATTSAEEILALNPDGVFLSNGPGDPAATGEYFIPQLKKLLEADLSIFGICLGHQLLALALGCTTTKMHQGHRGSNHPVQDLSTRKVEITSQNHGFVVSKNALPDDVEITHLSLFDDTVEGIKSKSKNAFSVQYHPESSPGPHDSYYLFERFIETMRK